MSSSSIQKTNDQSIVSKLSAANRGYFQDEVLKYFVEKSCQRSPLINRGYYIRFKAIEYAFDSWFDHFTHISGKENQIISLGAGFDTSYFRLKKLGKLKSTQKFIEIDFPEVLFKKSLLILSNEELALNCDINRLSANLSPEVILQATDYTLLGMNMKDINKMKSLFDTLQVDYTLPTLFLAECSLAYMDVAESDKLLNWISKNFDNSTFVMYEQVYPNDGFGHVMKNHFISIGSPLKSIDLYPDPQSVCNRFSKAGWSTKQCISMNYFFHCLPVEERDKVLNLEQFDEYEMWHLKCSHYVLVSASKGSLSTFCILHSPEVPQVQKLKIYASTIQKKETTIHLQRWGHGVVKISSNQFLVYGGFGYMCRQHRRLTHLVSYNIEDTKTSELEIVDPKNLLGEVMHHTMTAISFGRIVLFGGRSSPNKSYGNIIVLHPIGSSLCNTIKNGFMQSGISCSKHELQSSLSYIAEKKSSSKPRWRHTASVAFINGTEVVIFFGGCTPTKKASNDCLQLSTHTWELKEIEMQGGDVPTPRHSHSSVENGNKEIIITGGLTAKEKCLNSVHVFQVENHLWTLLNVRGLLPRYSHTSHIWNDHLILVGGVNDLPGFPPYIAVVGLMSLTAVELVMPGQETDDMMLLHNHSSLLSNNSIITVGGGGNCFSFGTHFNEHLLIFDVNTLVSAYSQ